MSEVLHNRETKTVERSERQGTDFSADEISYRPRCSTLPPSKERAFGGRTVG